MAGEANEAQFPHGLFEAFAAHEKARKSLERAEAKKNKALDTLGRLLVESAGVILPLEVTLTHTRQYADSSWTRLAKSHHIPPTDYVVDGVMQIEQVRSLVLTFPDNRVLQFASPLDSVSLATAEDVAATRRSLEEDGR